MELFEIELIIHIKMDLVLNNLQRLICPKTQPTNHPNIQQVYNTSSKIWLWNMEINWIMRKKTES